MENMQINKDIADVERDKRKKIENCYNNPSIRVFLFQDFKRTFNLKSPSKYVFRFIRNSSLILQSWLSHNFFSIMSVGSYLRNYGQRKISKSNSL